MTAFKKVIYVAICIIAQTGCATFKSLDADVPLAQRIFIYSGTRLDWAALENNDVAIRKFNTVPPSLPLVDLPFSFAFDSLFLPLAVSAEIFH
jgi:uncharacterized protein YceK